VDPNNISEEEKKLLAQIAKQKNKTMEEVLEELGHKPVPEKDEVVEFGGEPAEPKPAAESFEIPVVPEAPLPPPPAAEVKEEPEQEEVEEKEQPMATMETICPQCGWNHSNEVIPEPSKQDKVSFLQVVLGAKVFSKKYTMFGGELTADFRTLTVKELDYLYNEAFAAQKAGVFSNATDYYEYLNRIRICLQVTSLKAKTQALHVTLPEGLTKKSHPGVDTYWDEFLDSKGIEYDKDRILLAVQDYILSDVLKTEHLHRVITHECAKFNRLVSKLEACVDNPDFWKGTEQRR
jgi:hypothetical protein